VTIEYLDLGDFLVIAEEVLGVPADNIASASRLDLAESALHAPAATFGDVEFYPDLATKAAVLCTRSSRTTRSLTATSASASYA
jgi:death-on-curing protein